MVLRTKWYVLNADVQRTRAQDPVPLHSPKALFTAKRNIGNRNPAIIVGVRKFCFAPRADKNGLPLVLYLPQDLMLCDFDIRYLEIRALKVA